MMIQSIKRVTLFGAVWLGALQMQAQSSTGSAYNAFGFGSLVPTGTSEFSSLGYTGIGTRLSSSVNLENPAALTAVKGPNHVFDVGFNVTKINQYNSSSSFSTAVGGLSAINFWVRTGNKSAMSFGLSQYSDARYDVTSNGTVSDVIGAYSVRYKGSGGLSKLYAAWAYDVFTSLSVGVRGGLIFGAITNEQILSGNALVEGTNITQEMNLAKAMLDVGVQYSVPLGKSKSVTFGFTYQPSISVDYEVDQEIMKEGYDTLSSDTDHSRTIPEKFGAGIQFALNNWAIMMDAELERWGVNDGGEEFEYKDLKTFSGGVVYRARENLEAYQNRVIYRAGYRYSDGYVDALGATFESHRFSLGLGLPVKRATSYINIGYAYQQHGEVGTRLVEEQLHKFTVSASIRDLWFIKKVYD